MLSELFITVLIFVLMFVHILIIQVITVVLNCWSCCIIQTPWWHSVLCYSILVQIREFQRYILAVGINIRCSNKCWRIQSETLNVSLESLLSLIFSAANFPKKPKIWLKFLVCSLQLILTARQAHLVNNINLDWFYHVTDFCKDLLAFENYKWCSWSGWQCVHAYI